MRSFALRSLVAALGCGAAAALAACGENPTESGGGGGGGTGGVPTVGSLLRLNAYVDDPCDTVANGFRQGRVAAVGTRAIVVADTANPPGGFTTADYASFAATFDSLVYPVDVSNFGAPADVDNNGGRVIVFFTSAVNALTPRDVDFVVGGFFFARDLFPKTASNPANACPGSNFAEMFYMLAPDPNGVVNGNVRRTADVARTSTAVLAHEFQHLINASRRLYVLRTDNFDEDVWLNEGLSHAAEELLFYRTGGLAPRQNLAAGDIRATSRGFAALRDAGFQNLSRYSDFLADPEDNSVYAPDDSLPTRGATWSFLRYAADRAVSGGAPSDSALFFRLVNSTSVGLPNLRAALAAVPGGTAAAGDWLRDWAVAAFADDRVPGLDARFAQRSWNFRSVLTGFQLTDGSFFNGGVYPLAAQTLADGQTATAAVEGGGATYLRFAVPAGGSATLTLGGAAGGVPGVVRAALVAEAGGANAVTTYDPGTATVTAAGGAAGPASYALVLFNADTAVVGRGTDNAARARTTVTVRGAGLAPAAALVAAAGPSVGPTRARLAAARLARPRLAAGGAADYPVVTDAPLMRRLRAISAAPLARRVAEARRAYAASTAARRGH